MKHSEVTGILTIIDLFLTLWIFLTSVSAIFDLATAVAVFDTSSVQAFTAHNKTTNAGGYF